MPLRTLLPASTLALALISTASLADTIQVAVASNFTAPAKDIAAKFEAQTGHKIELSFGSSGKFYAQISNGAPFEVFLSADQAKPEALVNDNVALADTRFTYAEGQLVLWSADPDKVDPIGKVLDQNDFNRLAMANPKLAPYGLAAIQTLETLDLVDETQTKWVAGNNIAQTFQYVDTSNADLGFIALSQITQNNKITHGSAWVIPDEFYQPIRQDAVLMKSAERNAAAQEFLDYLKSDSARQVIQSYGYKLQ